MKKVLILEAAFPYRKPPFRTVLLMAERERFELSIPCGMHAFQACALGHYATSPCGVLLNRRRGR